VTVAGTIKIVLTAAVVAVLCWAGYARGRDLSLFRVRHVTVSGIDGRDAPTIRRALVAAGGHMTTLHVRKDELEHAVDAFPVVRSLSASADFPNTLHVKVNEYVPIAALAAPNGRTVAVSSANTLLRAVPAKARLPRVAVEGIPTSGTLEEARARRLVQALAAAPRALRPLLERAYASQQGIRVPLREGPVLYLGDGSRLAAEWAAAASVLADPAAKGARFIDLRLPERPAAGGFAPGSGSTGR
jgi:cell division protein FtsQ